MVIWPSAAGAAANIIISTAHKKHLFILI